MAFSCLRRYISCFFPCCQHKFQLVILFVFVIVSSIFYYYGNNEKIISQVHLTLPSPIEVLINEEDEHRKRTSGTFECKNKTVQYEDILCMESPEFLRNYKNPCWLGGTLKCLPYFHIIGGAKCGTTDLFNRITAHPQILKNMGIGSKETMYWSWKRYGECEYSKYCTGGKTMKFNDYLQLFPSMTIQQNKIRTENYSIYHHLITGTGDPAEHFGMYHWKRIPQNDPELDEPIYTTPHLIKHMNPNVKLIFILREPSERIYSHYLFRHLGQTPWRFHREATIAVNRVKKCFLRHSIRACLFNETLIYELKKFNIHGSFYSLQLKEWFSVFPREQFFIFRTEDYRRDTAGYLGVIFKFLDLKEISKDELIKISSRPIVQQTRRLRSARKMFKETKQMLDNFLQEYDSDLPDILHDTKYTWSDVKHNDTMVNLDFEAEFVEECVKFRKISRNSDKTRTMNRLKDICDALQTETLKSFLLGASDEFSDIELLLGILKSRTKRLFNK